MSAFRPEAEPEYSRGHEPFPDPSGAPDGPRGGSSRTVATAVLAGALVGAAILLAAEFTPLLKVHSSLHREAVASVRTGSHHSYALVPIAVLSIFFSFAVWRTRNRLGLLATAVLGLVALLIALIRDLPSAQSTGLTNANVLAKSSPSIGMYLETLGAVLLLIAAVAGLLLLAAPEPRRPRPGRAAGVPRDHPPRSGS